MCDSEVMVLEAIVLRVEVMRLLINRMLPYLLLLEAYAHGSDSFIVVICVCCHNCVLSFTRKALQETYMNNTFVHLAVILMHSFAATGDYQRFSALFHYCGKEEGEEALALLSFSTTQTQIFASSQEVVLDLLDSLISFL